MIKFFIFLSRIVYTFLGSMLEAYDSKQSVSTRLEKIGKGEL